MYVRELNWVNRMFKDIISNELAQQFFLSRMNRFKAGLFLGHALYVELLQCFSLFLIQMFEMHLVFTEGNFIEHKFSVE
jgi:hypothetical protein